MMDFPNIASCLIIGTTHLSQLPLVLSSSDNRSSTVLCLSKLSAKYNRRTIKLDCDFSNVIALVLLSFKLIYHVHRLFGRAERYAANGTTMRHSQTQTVLIGRKSNISSQLSVTPRMRQNGDVITNMLRTDTQRVVPTANTFL